MYMYNWLSIGDALGTAMLELSAKALTSCYTSAKMKTYSKQCVDIR